MDNSFIAESVTKTTSTPVLTEQLFEKVCQFLTGSTDTSEVGGTQLGQYCNCPSQQQTLKRKAKQRRRMAGTRHLPYGQQNRAPSLGRTPGSPPLTRAPGRPPRWWALISDYDFHSKQEIALTATSSSPPKWWSLEADDSLYEDNEENLTQDNVCAKDNVKEVEKDISKSITQRQVSALEKLAMDMCRNLHLR